MKEVINLENITEFIYTIRGQKVMLDFDLALLYGVENRSLKRQVRRNINRFPTDFMFELTKKEWVKLVPNWHKLENIKYTPSLPFAFTEHGVAMLAGILNSEQAIEANIRIIRTFIDLRKRILNYEDLFRKIEELEHKTDNKLFDHEQQIKLIFEVIQKMMYEDEEKNERKIGFDTSI